VTGGPAPGAPRPVLTEPVQESRPSTGSGPQAALGALRKTAKAPESPAPAPASAAAPPAPAPAAPAPEPAPVLAPEPVAAPSSGGEGPLTLDNVAAAWAKAVDGFRPRLKAMAKEAHPIRVEGDTVVVGLPSRFEKVHLPTITGESATVIAALSELLGRKVRLNVVLDENVAAPSGDGPPPSSVPASDPGVGAEAMVAEMTRPPEPGGGGRGVDSPVGLVIETFGASIESETVRE
jgi:hypothetical protein